MKLVLIVGGLIVVAVVVAVLMNGRKETPPSQVEMPKAPAAPPSPADAQAAFLTENLKNPEWKATDSGLQYRVLKAVEGAAAKPAPGSEVTVQYEGRLINDKVFDSSYARNEPATFPLSNVIRGWQEGVPLMKVGETFEFAIPAALAYGDRGTGPIPGGATLLFKIELLSAKTPA